MSEQLYFSDTQRGSTAFLPLLLFGLSLALTLGFQMADKIKQRQLWETTIAQCETAEQNSQKVQNRMKTLLNSFHQAAPDEAKELCQKLGLQYTPPSSQ